MISDHVKAASCRIHERDRDFRGTKENAYVCTNGQRVDPNKWWVSKLTGSTSAITAAGTTILGLYNNDDAFPVLTTLANIEAKVPTYGTTIRNRPIWIDEIRVEVMPVVSGQTVPDLKDYRLSASVIWVDPVGFAINTFRGTCDAYGMANYVLGSINPSGIVALWRSFWGADQLDNAGVGGTEQPNTIPVGGGPNAIGIYANASGEVSGSNVSRVCVPSITDTPYHQGIYISPKNTIELRPGRAILIQLNNLTFPATASGDYMINAWIKFRQPLLDEPFEWNRMNQYQQP